MLKLITKIHSLYQQNVKQPIDDISKHVQQFVGKNRLGGLLDMRSGEYKELIQLRNIYEECIIQGKKSEKETKGYSLFDIKEEEKKLAASEHEIEACFRYEANKNHGNLRSLMESIFKIIKYCVQLRLSGGSSSYTYLDGTVVLFCAEFCQWINQIAKQKVDELMLEEVKDRIKYLFELELRRIFPKEVQTKDYAVDVLIFHLRIILQKEVIPQIEQKLFNRCSRDWFEDLGDESKDFVNQIARGLCYLYTEAEEPPQVFTLEIDNTDVKLMTEPWNGTLLGNSLNLLRERYKSFIHDKPSPNTNDFIDDKGLIHTNLLAATPFLLEDSKKNEKKNDKKVKLGIHSFLNNPKAKNLLLMTLGYLEDYCLLLRSFRIAYQLAGYGGDVGMFLGFCQESNTMLASYKVLERKISTCISMITQIADEKRLELNNERKDSLWITNYGEAIKIFNRATEAKKRCDDTIHKILLRMEQVQSGDYQEECQERIQDFKIIIDVISQRIQPSVNEMISSSTKKILVSSKETHLLEGSKEGDTPLDRAEKTLSRYRHFGNDNNNPNSKTTTSTVTHTSKIP